MAAPFRLATRDIQLAGGDIIPVGMNFYALRLMARYKGGLGKLKKDMEMAVSIQTMDQESEAYADSLDAALDGLGYMLWALVRAGGTVCTVEECSMAIGLEDFAELHQVFNEFMERAAKMQNLQGKNA